ncbi:glucose-1-phosphate cytidylyltransferase [Leadbetterella byssophila DSM 17132]|uniref:Glucose-1-phosphate cytidylyltransferase n=1 Tax=Leadbetterella byssophila (strain DSM 17132 / JCM 16389 / KACC 11308 / NBRC 106382 / 4M15) TaxID=649349 RepID=E4RXR9_LEAB4|nr:glucose-1-phosphate cytidylyltransferase [Leadbetterella byssophila]ADQ18133.1 glucose-1-phosphate cytidylyltransferase [Leadbetterella byssophila DSM 17132]
MKAVILAGGFGTRFSEATGLIPKPMIEIGGKPILWHIMKIYSHYGITEFIICCGYKQYVIKEYFANYFHHNSDITVDLADNSIHVHDNHAEKWKVTMIDTGLNTMTGGRIKRVQKYVGNETFLLTYGDGVADIDISKSIESHQKSKAILTVTAYKPSGKFGALEIAEDNSVKAFLEKPDGDGNWINAGYFICEPEVFNYIRMNDDTVVFEKSPLESIAKDGKMNAYKHRGFWKPMDTLRDNVELNELWSKGNAPWKVW